MLYCAICGDDRETSGLSYRPRCLMTMCFHCYREMPLHGHKVQYGDFLALTFGGKDDRTSREFYSDYKASTIFDVAEYWEKCSSPI